MLRKLGVGLDWQGGRVENLRIIREVLGYIRAQEAAYLLSKSVSGRFGFASRNRIRQRLVHPCQLVDHLEDSPRPVSVVRGSAGFLWIRIEALDLDRPPRRL